MNHRVHEYGLKKAAYNLQKSFSTALKSSINAFIQVKLFVVDLTFSFGGQIWLRY
jgi:hypothetical protein